MKSKIFSTTALLSVAGLGLVAGCSSSTSKPTTTQPSASSPATSSPSPSTSSSTPAAAGAIGTGSASVSGAQQTVLTASDGKTLYYFTPDNAGGMPTCTASCASAWPPVIVSGTPTAGSGVTGTLTAVMGGNGDQAAYNGHPLYEFGQDSAAGQANGEGVAGKWFVATPSLAAGAGAGQPSSSPSTSGGSRY
jgi:predicted lipoprotein with Yx(FWY)xxD motif